MRQGNRAPHTIGIGQNGFPLGSQFIDQGTDTAFIVRIGPFQIGDFGSD